MTTLTLTLSNLTPHTLNLVLPDGSVKAVPPSGQVARCASTSSQAGEFDGIPLSKTTFGQVQDLPEPQDGTLFVVSALVRQAVPHRTDVASPGDLVRDADGNVVGCKGLIVN